MSPYWTRAALAALALILPATAARAGDDPRHLLVTDPGAAAFTRYHVGLPYKPLLTPRRLTVGEKIRCSERCRLVVDDGSSLILDPGAVLEASSPRFVRIDRKRMAERCQVVTLLSGSMRVHRAGHSAALVIDTRSGDTLAIRSGRAKVASIDGGVVVVPNGDTSLKRGRTWQKLTAGRAHRMKQQVLTERAAVVTPTWKRNDANQYPIALAVTGPTGVVQSAWNPVEGAEHYIVDIATDAAFVERTKQLLVETPQFETSLSEGRYWARVTPVDEDGLDAPPSAPRALRVVRVAIPPSAFMPERGTLVVPKEAVLRILDTEGIELSVDRSGFWPAPRIVKGPTQAAHRLRLRLTGDPLSMTTLRLEQRALHAQVRMTPNAPSWPTDVVQVSIRLDDPSGRIEPSTVEPSMEVRLAGKTIPASWERDGDVWRARIAGRSLAAPSLLEVVARDDAGLPLGWGFLELVSSGEASRRR